LQRLREENVVKRDVDGASTPPSVTYSLTEKGDDLADVVAEIEAIERRYE
jgi:DNA-binding HxlR family transcriptional regulator